MRRVRQVRLAVAGLVAVAALVGCSDGGGKASESLPSTSRTAASSSASLPPLGPADFPVPVEARQQTPAGAKAFVAYYVELMSRAQLELQPDGLRDLSSDCDVCQRFADGIDGYRQMGLHATGGGIHLDGVSEPAVTGSRAEFSIGLTQAAFNLSNPDGTARPDLSAVGKTFPASGAATVWSTTDMSWLMAEITIQ